MNIKSSFCILFRMPDKVLKPEDFDQRNRGKSWMPQLGFQKHSGYRGGKDSSAANRMLRLVVYRIGVLDRHLLEKGVRKYCSCAKIMFKLVVWNAGFKQTSA